jgi:hypothetical protein
MKAKGKQRTKILPIYKRIRQILESAQTNAARSVNTSQVVANWLIGHEIVEEEQKGKRHAGYGEELIAKLARQFRTDGTRGYSEQNLCYVRQFYRVYPELLPPEICHALRGKSEIPRTSGVRIRRAVRGKLVGSMDPAEILYAVRKESTRHAHLQTPRGASRI